MLFEFPPSKNSPEFTHTDDVIDIREVAPQTLEEQEEQLERARQIAHAERAKSPRRMVKATRLYMEARAKEESVEPVRQPIRPSHRRVAIERGEHETELNPDVRPGMTSPRTPSVIPLDPASPYAEQIKRSSEQAEERAKQADAAFVAGLEALKTQMTLGPNHHAHNHATTPQPSRFQQWRHHRQEKRQDRQEARHPNPTVVERINRAPRLRKAIAVTALTATMVGAAVGLSRSRSDSESIATAQPTTQQFEASITTIPPVVEASTTLTATPPPAARQYTPQEIAFKQMNDTIESFKEADPNATSFELGAKAINTLNLAAYLEAHQTPQS